MTGELAEVLQKAGKKPGEIIVGGIDLAPATIDGLKSGYITVTLDQQLYLQGFIPVLQCVHDREVQDAGPLDEHRRRRVTPDTIDDLIPLIDKGIPLEAASAHRDQFALRTRRPRRRVLHSKARQPRASSDKRLAATVTLAIDGRRSERIFSTCSAVAVMRSPADVSQAETSAPAAVGDHALREVAMRGLQAVARLLQRQALVVVAGRDLLRHLVDPAEAEAVGDREVGLRRLRDALPGAVGDRNDVRRMRQRRQQREPRRKRLRHAARLQPMLDVVHGLHTLARQQRGEHCGELFERGAIMRDGPGEPGSRHRCCG